MIAMWIVIILCGLGSGYYFFSKHIYSKTNLLREYNTLIDKKQNILKQLDRQIEKNEQFIYYQNDITNELNNEIISYQMSCEYLKLEHERLYNLKDKEIQEYEAQIEAHKQDLEENIQNIVITYAEKTKKLQKTLQGYEDKIKTYIEEQKRKEEMNSKIDFYRLTLTELEISDVIKLIEISSSVSQPDILKKLIYKTYFEKKMNDLLGRVVGANSEIAGIYKITHIDSGKSYIGQTVNMKDRWRTHLKRGLGIEAPSSNKFYQSMYELKPWNFTWEVLETCKKEELNEKEKYWIEFHQTNSWGWNSKGGNR